MRRTAAVLVAFSRAATFPQLDVRIGNRQTGFGGLAVGIVEKRPE